MYNPSWGSDPQKAKSSNIRWTILGLCLLISLITYLDRVNISIAARYIIAENQLSTVQMGTVFSAFTFSYAIFQVPGGWLADRFGPRVVLTAAILWWSGFTALTAVATGIAAKFGATALGALLLVRACLGAGEAAAWPCFNCIIANWVPLKGRAFASSIPLAGGGIGAAVAPPLIAWIMLHYGWHWAFYVCALVGVVFSVAWVAWVRNRPTEHEAVNAAELRLIAGPQDNSSSEERPKGSIPLRTIFAAPNTWLLFLSNFCCGYLIYIYLSWFYVYLTEVRKMPLMQGSLYTTEPFLAIAVMSLLGGYLGDRAVARFGIATGRRIIALPGMVLAAVALFVGARIPGIGLSVFCLAIGAGAIYLALTAHWATSIDVAKEYAGTVSGVMNWGGNFGGVISPILTPWIARRWGWLPALEVAAAIVLSGSFLWLVIAPEARIVRKGPVPLPEVVL
jgi:MFS transporter, ACS family, glucarate transporter